MCAFPQDHSTASPHRVNDRAIGCALGVIAVLVGCQWIGASSPPPPTDEEIKAMRVEGEARQQRMVDLLTPPVESIRTMPPSVEGSLPVLEPYREWTLAETAQDSLSRIGAASVPDIIPLLDDADPKVRVRALRVLARIGPEASVAVPAVRRCLSDPDLQVRQMAVRALGQIGADAAAAVPDLIELLQSDEAGDEAGDGR